MIRHFFQLTLAFLVSGLPCRVKPRASRCLLIIGPITPLQLLTRQICTIVLSTIALPSVASLAYAHQLTTTITGENPITRLFHRGPIPTSAGPLPPFQRFLTLGHRYHRGDGPEGSGGKPWAFTLSALGYYLIIPVTILKAALPTLQIRRAQLAGVYHCASLVKLFFVSIPQFDYKNRIYYPYPFLKINNHSKKITEYWPVNWNFSAYLSR